MKPTILYGVEKASVRIIIIVLLLFSATAVVNAQQKQGSGRNTWAGLRGEDKRTIIDYAPIRVRYALNATNINDRSTWIDEGQLKIGESGLLNYSSLFIEMNEDSIKSWKKRHPKSKVQPIRAIEQGRRSNIWSEYQFSMFFIKDGILTEWAAMPMNAWDQNSIYSEPWPAMSWKLSDEKKKICGYECQKATSHFRGRDFTAWFTTDIPVKGGPWKFGGLPGLILKVYDIDGLYTFEAIKIEKGRFPIYEYDRSMYKNSSRKKVWDLQRRLNEDWHKTTGTVTEKDGIQTFSKPSKYDQLELE